MFCLAWGKKNPQCSFFCWGQREVTEDIGVHFFFFFGGGEIPSTISDVFKTTHPRL